MTDKAPKAPSPAPRRPWVTPRLGKMPLRDTANGIDPIVQDGDFSFGS